MHTFFWSLSQELLNLGLLLFFLAIALFKPALGRLVLILSLVGRDGRQVSSDSGDICSPAFFGSVIGGRNPAQGRSGRKEREKVRRQLVRHCDRESCRGMIVVEFRRQVICEKLSWVKEMLSHDSSRAAAGSE